MVCGVRGRVCVRGRVSGQGVRGECLVVLISNFMLKHICKLVLLTPHTFYGPGSSHRVYKLVPTLVELGRVDSCSPKTRANVYNSYFRTAQLQPAHSKLRPLWIAAVHHIAEELAKRVEPTRV